MFYGASLFVDYRSLACCVWLFVGWWLWWWKGELYSEKHHCCEEACMLWDRRIDKWKWYQKWNKTPCSWFSHWPWPLLLPLRWWQRLLRRLGQRMARGLRTIVTINHNENAISKETRVATEVVIAEMDITTTVMTKMTTMMMEAMWSRG